MLKLSEFVEFKIDNETNLRGGKKWATTYLGGGAMPKGSADCWDDVENTVTQGSCS